MFSRQQDLVERSEQLQPTDRLVALKPMTCFGVRIERGEVIPNILDSTRMRQLLITRYAKVLDPSEPVQVAIVAAPPAAQTPATKPSDDIKCDKCERTFKTKLNLGAHKRSHRG